MLLLNVPKRFGLAFAVSGGGRINCRRSYKSNVGFKRYRPILFFPFHCFHADALRYTVRAQ